LKDLPVEVLDYPGNVGPAKARNRGFGIRDEVPPGKLLGALVAAFSGAPIPEYAKHGFDPRLQFADWVTNPGEFTWASDIEWFYFTDCGCEHDPNLFHHFAGARAAVGDSCVAVCGPVVGKGDGPINRFMTEQGILNAPRRRVIDGVTVPEAILRRLEKAERSIASHGPISEGMYLPQGVVTANVLVAGLPFAFLGGFDPAFRSAAGEDLDLGIRLRQIGTIAWSENARVTHRFEEDEGDFRRRFQRYGRGNRQLELKHNLPSMRATKFSAEQPELQRWADMSVEAMQSGYDEACSGSEQGVLRVLR
jgi:hypothetical protein